MQACLQRSESQKCFIVFLKTKLKGKFQTLFYKGLFLTFKGFIFKSQLALCKQNLWPQSISLLRILF
jgi:hypothetical protein